MIDITIATAVLCAAFGSGFAAGWQFRRRAHRAEVLALDVERRAWLDLALEINARNFVFRGLFDDGLREALAEPPRNCGDCGATLAEVAGRQAGDHAWTCLHCDEQPDGGAQ